MKMTKKQYQQYAESKADKSKLWLDMFNAFWIGGLICMIGQFFLNTYMNLNFDKEIAGTLTSITLVFASALLTGLNVYDNIAKKAGAGTLVPITGFANAVVSPAMEFKNEGYVMGVAANIFKIAGPVITYGIIASVLSGIIYLFL
ncbi:MAG: stage V sporulation protein AC [Clostridia bacterium]|nr:stage V sporulation protein AC [Clostridia bacterium]